VVGTGECGNETREGEDELELVNDGGEGDTIGEGSSGACTRRREDGEGKERKEVEGEMQRLMNGIRHGPEVWTWARVAQLSHCGLAGEGEKGRGTHGCLTILGSGTLSLWHCLGLSKSASSQQTQSEVLAVPAALPLTLCGQVQPVAMTNHEQHPDRYNTRPRRFGR
jgi:hypothetical protein